MLSPREIDKMLIYSVAELARKRMLRGLKLNYSESIAMITENILEGARDGKSVADLMQIGKKVLKREDVMLRVPEMIHLVQVECTFPDGTKLVSCHDPII
jgi:urease subunit gamma